MNNTDTDQEQLDAIRDNKEIIGGGCMTITILGILTIYILTFAQIDKNFYKQKKTKKMTKQIQIQQPSQISDTPTLDQYYSRIKMEQQKKEITTRIENSITFLNEQEKFLNEMICNYIKNNFELFEKNIGRKKTIQLHDNFFDNEFFSIQEILLEMNQLKNETK